MLKKYFQKRQKFERQMRPVCRMYHPVCGTHGCHSIDIILYTADTVQSNLHVDKYFFSPTMIAKPSNVLHISIDGSIDLRVTREGRRRTMSIHHSIIQLYHMKAHRFLRYLAVFAYILPLPAKLSDDNIVELLWYTYIVTVYNIYTPIGGIGTWYLHDSASFQISEN